MRSLSASMALFLRLFAANRRLFANGRTIIQRGIGERRGATLGCGKLAAVLRPGIGLTAGRNLIEDAFERLGSEILIGVFIDQNHRRIHAGTEALDLLPREFTIGGEMMRLRVNLAPQDILQFLS